MHSEHTTLMSLQLKVVSVSAHLQLTLLVFLSIHVCIKYSQQFYVHTSRGLKAGGLSCGATNLDGGFMYSRYCVMQVTNKYQLITVLSWIVICVMNRNLKNQDCLSATTTHAGIQYMYRFIYIYTVKCVWRDVIIVFARVVQEVFGSGVHSHHRKGIERVCQVLELPPHPQLSSWKLHWWDTRWPIPNAIALR